MKLELVVRELALEDAARVLESEWGRSQDSLPGGDPLFLEPEFVARACGQAGIPAEITEAVVAAATRIARHPAARALVWHLHHCLFAAPDYPRDLIGRWPSLDRALGDDGRVVYLLALLSGIPLLEQFNAERAIPVEVTRETLSDIVRWLGGDEDVPANPPWGITPRAISWLVHHLKGELYRLGRLQFEYAPFDCEAVALRNRATKAVLALSEQGIGYREDGGRVSTDVFGSAGAWTARLTETEDLIAGNPISPDGKAHHEQIALQTAEWEVVLRRGMPALRIHIPTGGPLTHEACGESFRRALQFFPRHFPDRPFNTFCCNSWLLDSELQDMLPETSNIVRFQREFYLLPRPLTSKHMLDNILGPDPLDLSVAPRRTGLQRAVVDLLSSGRSLRPTGGGCLLLTEDFHWGGQVYLRQQRRL